MAEPTPTQLFPGFWLRVRVVPPSYEPPKKVEMPPGSKYQGVYSSFGIGDLICEVMRDDEVIGVLPNFQGFQVGSRTGDITQDIVMHFLCFESPYAGKNEIHVR